MTQMPHRPPTGRRTRGRLGRVALIVLAELLHAVVWVPLLLACLLLVLAAQFTVPGSAEAERAIARRLGTPAPSGREDGERLGRWLVARVADAAFWRQDLPLCLGSALLSTVGAAVTFNGVTFAVTCLLAPLIASPRRPVNIALGRLNTVATQASDVWWLLPLGLTTLALTLGLLAGVGTVRLRLVAALSGDAQEQRVRQLQAEVGHLSAGRATLVDAFEAERERIERDLHDGAQRELVALTMSLGGLRLRAESLPRDEATEPVRQALLTGLDASQDRTEAALRSLRETVRGIRPAVLSERGLAPALRDLAGRAPLATSVRIEGAEAELAAISSPVAAVIYFAVSEALTNAAKYAGTDDAVVRLSCSRGWLSVVVSDDGCGGADPAAPGATGLRGMIQRVESVGGSMLIDSPAGGGTRVAIGAPMSPSWAQDRDDQDEDVEHQGDLAAAVPSRSPTAV